MKSLVGKVALVTGGASGLGYALAERFLGAGMKVALADIEADALQQASETLTSDPELILPVQLDVTDRLAMEDAADKVARELGNVHVLCNNAGVAVGGAIDDMTYADWDWVMGVNVGGVINGIQTFLPRIRAHGEGGHIVNTASLAGHRVSKSFSIYNTSKFAVVGMSEAIRLDLAGSDIGISVLCPGVADTRILASWRNRPAALDPDDELASRLVSSGEGSFAEREASMERIFAAGLAPATIARMVLFAIENDEFYIFTHPEHVDGLTQRHGEIAASYARWASRVSLMEAAE